MNYRTSCILVTAALVGQISAASGARAACYLELPQENCCSPFSTNVLCNDDPLYPCTTIQVSCGGVIINDLAVLDEVGSTDYTTDPCLISHVHRECQQIDPELPIYACIVVSSFGTLKPNLQEAGQECQVIEQ